MSQSNQVQDTGIHVQVFDGSPAVAQAIAKLHLQVRQQQEDSQENKFTDILDSQTDLINTQIYYVQPGGQFFIATDMASGAIAGFVGLRSDGHGQGTLKRLAVMPEYRRQGIGIQLVGELVRWAARHKYSKICLSTGVTERAKPIYEKAGFVETGFDNEHQDYRMELGLTPKISTT
jgi:ribosomal protein S18 acetylase RimI-like enzyme